MNGYCLFFSDLTIDFEIRLENFLCMRIAHACMRVCSYFYRAYSDGAEFYWARVKGVVMVFFLKFFFKIKHAKVDKLKFVSKNRVFWITGFVSLQFEYNIRLMHEK